MFHKTYTDEEKLEQFDKLRKQRNNAVIRYHKTHAEDISNHRKQYYEANKNVEEFKEANRVKAKRYYQRHKDELAKAAKLKNQKKSKTEIKGRNYNN